MSLLLLILPIVAAQIFNASSSFQQTSIASAIPTASLATDLLPSTTNGFFGVFSSFPDTDLQIFTLCYTRPFPTICGSEICDYMYTITEYCTTPCEPEPTGIPSGFTTTITEFGGIDVTLTEPIPEYLPTNIEFPTDSSPIIKIFPIETGFPDPENSPIIIDPPEDCLGSNCGAPELEPELMDTDCGGLGCSIPELEHSELEDPELEDPELEDSELEWSALECGGAECSIPDPDPEPVIGFPEIDIDTEPEVYPSYPGIPDAPQIEPLPVNTDGPCTLICIPEVPAPSSVPTEQPPNCFTRCSDTGAPPAPTSPPNANNLTASVGAVKPTVVNEGEKEPGGTGEAELFTGGAAGRTEWTALVALGFGVVVAVVFM